MQDREVRRRYALGLAFALLAGLAVACANPVARFKADLRADAKGFALSLEYAAREVVR